jgi:hypothetical protein
MYEARSKDCIDMTYGAVSMTGDSAARVFVPQLVVEQGVRSAWTWTQLDTLNVHVNVLRVALVISNVTCEL